MFVALFSTQLGMYIFCPRMGRALNVNKTFALYSVFVCAIKIRVEDARMSKFITDKGNLSSMHRYNIYPVSPGSTINIAVVQYSFCYGYWAYVHDAILTSTRTEQEPNTLPIQNFIEGNLAEWKSVGSGNFSSSGRSSHFFSGKGEGGFPPTHWEVTHVKSRLPTREISAIKKHPI